jgi:hypothetical protein
MTERLKIKNPHHYGMNIVGGDNAHPFDVEQGLIWRTGHVLVVADVHPGIGISVVAHPVTTAEEGERAITEALVGCSDGTSATLDDVCAQRDWIIDDQWFDPIEGVCFLYPVEIGQRAELASQWGTTSSGTYQGVVVSEWDGEPIHFFTDGEIGGAAQDCFGHPAPGLSITNPLSPSEIVGRA